MVQSAVDIGVDQGAQSTPVQSSL
jgi:hypothetical protein